MESSTRSRSLRSLLVVLLLTLLVLIGLNQWVGQAKADPTLAYAPQSAETNPLLSDLSGRLIR